MGSLEDDGIGEDSIEYDQSPSTIATMTSSATKVVAGGSVNLTVTEHNDGDVDLVSPQVAVTKNGALLATLVAPPSSDDNGDGVLNVDEIWSWTINQSRCYHDHDHVRRHGQRDCPRRLSGYLPR